MTLRIQVLASSNHIKLSAITIIAFMPKLIVLGIIATKVKINANDDDFTPPKHEPKLYCTAMKVVIEDFFSKNST